PREDATDRPGPVPRGPGAFGSGPHRRAAGSARAYEMEPMAREGQARPRVAVADRVAHVVFRDRLLEVLGAGAGGARLPALPLAEWSPDPNYAATTFSTGCGPSPTHNRGVAGM